MLGIFDSFAPELLLFLASVLLVAGCVRGFAGFGAGMIFIPVATSVVAPATAAATFLFIDSIVTLPLLIRAVRHCNWATVLPAAFGAVIFVHLGAWLLASTDVLILRWAIFAIVTCLLALLISGWRYHRQPAAAVSFATGSVSGVLGGISQVSAPPVVAMWLSSANDPAIVRANMIVFFTLASVGTFVAYTLNGFFTQEVFRLLIMAVPVYGLAIFAGARGFSKADPAVYRKFAYVLIAVAALTSMPALDPLLR
ncbi:putative membrane protein YfcA [Labrenzia sp. EL_208]|nr:putative membrane protein YfcA [Labrenzia sp. EL_132]MBG6230476.1 putative membrane protein YfcA [Labrenzia sp. EL_208]MCR9061928.1 sulfite exporter TauE/SafE family protein [Paracoccaceae bacterium]